MLIRLQIQSPGFNLQTVLQSNALPALIEFVQKHRVTDMEELQRHRRLGPNGPSQRNRPGSPSPQTSAPLNAGSTAQRASLTDLTAEALFALLESPTFPEKLLVATGWLEARQADGTPPHRRDIKRLLVRLGNEPPANPGRDFRSAMNEGWLVETGERCLNVTNEGWAKIGTLTAGATDD